MGNVGKDEWNPGEKQVPDQPDVPACFAVRHARGDQPDAHGAGSVEQDEHGKVMPVANGKVSKFVEHFSAGGGHFQNGCHPILSLLDQIKDHINVTGRMTQSGQYCGGFGLVLCAVIDYVCHHLP